MEVTVIVGKKLKFHKYVSTAVSKANQILDIVKMTFLIIIKNNIYIL